MNIEFINNNEIYTPDFKLEERVGEGGFGYIYKVSGPFKTSAVIKIGDKTQLVNEYSMYKILSKIIPANIPKCYRFGECKVNNTLQFFIIIEYIEYTLCDGNKSLAKQFSTNAEIKPIYMNIFNDLVDILYKIHQHGFIHRDIKPSNILIKQINNVYVPVLIDFGLIDTIINISGDQVYYAGTRCYSSIYQHFGLSATPIDDYINLVYTWMKVMSTITKGNSLPWDSNFIRQDKKKHEFYACEKWLYTFEYSNDNFFDKVLNYLYNLPHFWTTIIDLKKIYYIDPLQRYDFSVHSITLPKQWKKFIKQESLTISKTQYLSEQLKDVVRVDDVIQFVKQRLNTSNTVNVSDYSLIFMQYMIKQYNTLVNYMWDNLKLITENFMNNSTQSVNTYLYSWLNNIQLSINKEIKVFDLMISSVNTYNIKDILSFFNYRRLQNILKMAINKLPASENTYSQTFASEYIKFIENLNKLYNRQI